MIQSDLTIHQLRVFSTVVRMGSLTQAALALDIPQPSISRLVVRLEEAVGAPLLNRFRTGVTVTAAGETFHAHAQRAVAFHDLAIEEARAASGMLIGDVVLAAPDSVGGILFAPLLQTLKAQHPNIRLRAFAAQSTAIPSLLAQSSVDIGIVADTHSPPPGQRDALFTEDLYLIGPVSSGIVRTAELPLKEIADLPLLLNALPGGFRTLIDRAFEEVGLSPNIQVEIDANNALLQLLLDDAGYAILPYSLVASAVETGHLRATRLVSPSLTRTLSLITAPNRPISASLREVIHQIGEVISQQADRARWHVLTETPPTRP